MSPQNSMLSILDRFNKINMISLRFNPHKFDVLGKVSLPVHQLNPYELGFYRATSWLYALYFESDRVNVDFLCAQLAAYNIEQDDGHSRIVQQMRTYFQHNLDPTREQNRMIQLTCEHWFQKQCQAHAPSPSKQWGICLQHLLGDALIFLTALRDCVRCIEQDERRENILQQWLFRRQRYHPHMSLTD